MTTDDEVDIELAHKTVHDLIKSTTEKRVSRDAADELNFELQEYGKKVSEKAREFAESNGRKTVRKDDIKRAVRVME